MKCKDCYARNGEDICLIGKKSRMLVCGHYGCDLQARVVERKMGIEKPFTNADRIRAMTDEELADEIALLIVEAMKQLHPFAKWKAEDRELISGTSEEVLEWLKQEVQE